MSSTRNMPRSIAGALYGLAVLIGILGAVAAVVTADSNRGEVQFALLAWGVGCGIALAVAANIISLVFYCASTLRDIRAALEDAGDRPRP